MKKIIASLFFIFFISISYAQNNFSIAIYEDVGLALRGDHHGHPPGTLNIVSRFKYNSKQRNIGYWMYFGEFEFAQLEGDYKRYSGNIGYTFNRIVFPKIWFIPRFELKNFETNFTIGYGAISRYDFTEPSFGYSIEFSYRFNKTFKINILSQGSERSDMIRLYGDSDSILGPLNTRESIFAGLEVSF